MNSRGLVARSGSGSIVSLGAELDDLIDLDDVDRDGQIDFEEFVELLRIDGELMSRALEGGGLPSGDGWCPCCVTAVAGAERLEAVAEAKLIASVLHLHLFRVHLSPLFFSSMAIHEIQECLPLVSPGENCYEASETSCAPCTKMPWKAPQTCMGMGLAYFA